jgi:gamma-glutamylputrescine synthase
LEIPQQAAHIKVKGQPLLLSTNQPDALALFHRNAVLQKYLGKRFMELWCAVKRAEHQQMYSQITLMEQHWDI